MSRPSQERVQGMGRRVNRVRRLTRQEESRLHQELLAAWDAEHGRLERTRIKTMIELAGSSPVIEKLCSEWGRL